MSTHQSAMPLMQQSCLVSTTDVAPVRSHKRALLIGIQYMSNPIKENRLDGSHSDVDDILKLLLRLGWKPDDIRILRDNGVDTPATRVEILKAIDWLVEGATRADHLWFYYAGHGDQEPDLNGDEPLDRPFDQAIVPSDVENYGKYNQRGASPKVTADITLHAGAIYANAPKRRPTRRRTLDVQETDPPTDHGYIIDDELRQRMCEPLPAGCRLVAWFDMCHSGTPLDLEYNYSTADIPARERSLFYSLMPKPLQLLCGLIENKGITPINIKTRHTRAYLRTRPEPENGIESTWWGLKGIFSTIMRALRRLWHSDCTQGGLLTLPIDPESGAACRYQEALISDPPQLQGTALAARHYSATGQDSPAFVQSPVSMYSPNEQRSVQWNASEVDNDRAKARRAEDDRYPDAATRPLWQIPPIVAHVVSVGACTDAERSDDKMSLAKILGLLHEHYGSALTYFELLLGLRWKVKPQHPQLSSSHKIIWSDHFLS